MCEIETSRLILRKINDDDRPSLTRLFQDEEVMEFSDGIKSNGEVNQWIMENNAQFLQEGFGVLGVTKKGTNELIGYCGLTKFDDINGREEIELGYRLHKMSWGFGYATEAASAVKNHAINSLTIKRLISIVSPKNSRSIGVATKLGMRAASEVMFPNYSYPDSLYLIEIE